MVISGNLPISSATIESTTTAEFRLISIALACEARTPLTITSSKSASAAGTSCASAVVDRPPSAQLIASTSAFFLGLKPWGLLIAHILILLLVYLKIAPAGQKREASNGGGLSLWVVAFYYLVPIPIKPEGYLDLLVT